MADMPILQLDKVSYEYRNKHQTVKAVNEFSYEFNQGLFSHNGNPFRKDHFIIVW